MSTGCLAHSAGRRSGRGFFRCLMKLTACTARSTWLTKSTCRSLTCLRPARLSFLPGRPNAVWATRRFRVLKLTGCRFLVFSNAGSSFSAKDLCILGFFPSFTYYLAIIVLVNWLEVLEYYWLVQFQAFVLVYVVQFGVFVLQLFEIREVDQVFLLGYPVGSFFDFC